MHTVQQRTEVKYIIKTYILRFAELTLIIQLYSSIMENNNATVLIIIIIINQICVLSYTDVKLNPQNILSAGKWNDFDKLWGETSTLA